MAREDEWPEYLEEREPEADVERVDELFKEQGVKITRTMEGTLKGSLEPGERINLHVSGLELEMTDGGIVAILVEGVPVWSGQAQEFAEVRTYTSAADKTLCGVAVNGKVVWVRQT